MEGLSMDNILGAEEIENLFEDNNAQEAPPDQKENDDNTTETVSVDSLFTEESESVGSEEEIIKEEEDTQPSKGDGASPNTNFYSSITKALQEEGIFPDLDDDLISSTKTAEDFITLINKQIEAGIDEKQRRVDEALNVGLEPSEIRRYEGTINYLNSIKEEHLSDESDKGEQLRKQLIYQDFINRGYSKERAEREVNKSFNSGSDIEDAKEALESNKDFYTKYYKDLIQEAKEEKKTQEEETRKKSEQLKKSIMEDTQVFGDLQLDKATRQKIYNNISKPVYKDPDTGELYTAIQKYEKENSIEFLKNVGLLYTLTDGFKDLDKIVKGKVNKEVKKGLKELERVLRPASRFEGNLKYTSDVGDEESNLSTWDVDI